MGEDPQQLCPKADRRIVCLGPLRSRDEFIAGRLQGLEIIQVAARPLIDDRVELEVHLVDPAGEVNRQRRTKDLRVETASEIFGQAELEQGTGRSAFSHFSSRSRSTATLCAASLRS